MQNKFNLRSVLPAMGISDALNPTAADFTGISGQYIRQYWFWSQFLKVAGQTVVSVADSLFLSAVEEGLYVSDAFHEVRIEVTEDGTKAAAATGRKDTSCSTDHNTEHNGRFAKKEFLLQLWCYWNDPVLLFSRRTGRSCFCCDRLTQVFTSHCR